MYFWQRCNKCHLWHKYDIKYRDNTIKEYTYLYLNRHKNSYITKFMGLWLPSHMEDSEIQTEACRHECHHWFCLLIPTLIITNYYLENALHPHISFQNSNINFPKHNNDEKNITGVIKWADTCFQRTLLLVCLCFRYAHSLQEKCTVLFFFSRSV